MSDQPSSKVLLPSDFPDVMEIEATYTNWFLATGGADGVRITFGESFDKGDEWVVGHQAVMMSLQTTVKLYNMLGGVIQALVNAKQQEMKEQLNKIAEDSVSRSIVPSNQKN